MRTALTMEMWDAINGAWLELKSWGNGAALDARNWRASSMRQKSLAPFRRRGLSHHAAQRRLLVLALGVYIERADNTARILDVKYHLAAAGDEKVGGSLDYFHGPRSCVPFRR